MRCNRAATSCIGRWLTGRSYVEHQRRHVKFRPASMFPGYIFVDPGPHGWAALRTADGIRRSAPLLMQGADYATLPDGSMDEIRRTELALLIGTSPSFTKGERVTFNEGPFAGMFAEVAEMDGDESVVLLMRLLGQEIRVKSSAK